MCWIPTRKTGKGGRHGTEYIGSKTSVRQLLYGKGLTRLLRQKQYHPYCGEEEVILLVCAMGRLFIPVPEKEINRVTEEMLVYFEKNRPDLADRIGGSEGLSDELRKEIISTAVEFLSKRNAG